MNAPNFASTVQAENFAWLCELKFLVNYDFCTLPRLDVFVSQSTQPQLFNENISRSLKTQKCGKFFVDFVATKRIIQPVNIFNSTLFSQWYLKVIHDEFQLSNRRLELGSKQIISLQLNSAQEVVSAVNLRYVYFSLPGHRYLITLVPL